MKKILILVVVLAVLLSACAQVAEGLVGLPEEGQILVMTLVTALVTGFLLWLGSALKLDLKGYIQPIVAIVAPIIITLIEDALNTIPPVLDNVVLTIIHLIVLLVGSVGMFLIFRRARLKETKALLY